MKSIDHSSLMMDNYTLVFQDDNPKHIICKLIFLLDLPSGKYKNLPLSSPILQDYPLKTPLLKRQLFQKEYKNRRGFSLGFSLSLKRTLLQEKDAQNNISREILSFQRVVCLQERYTRINPPLNALFKSCPGFTPTPPLEHPGPTLLSLFFFIKL